jgi:hypothetical protein
MNRTTLASAVLLAAALATAGCGAGSSAASSAAASSTQAADGTQSYTSILDLGTAVEAATKCSGLAIQPTTLAKAQATCDLPSGSKLVLQVWRDAAGRDGGVKQQAAAATNGYCFVEGRGDKALWSVDASADASACTAVAKKTGGQVVKADGSSKG